MGLFGINMRKKKTDSQIESNKKGKERIRQYEERQSGKVETPTEKTTDDEEERCIICWQRIMPGEWEEIKYIYKRKKK
jgi:hypothetical protein